jgi:hypothetical protein
MVQGEVMDRKGNKIMRQLFVAKISIYGKK